MSPHLNFHIHLPNIKHLVSEVEGMLAKDVEAELAANPAADKASVESAIVAKADLIIEAAATRVPGAALIVPFLMGYLNHLIEQGVGSIYDAVKAKLDEIASAPVQTVAN